jgi:asparagine synthase (glutamine-hydrolysing)
VCGLAALVALDGELAPALAASLRPITAALAHRGPDGEGFIDCGFASLGHRRLSIIDRAGGHQPMANEDDTCWIIFNGEIYNHKPLRRELESRGHRFNTASDTEVILHAYEEFGPACLDRLNGMFAFVICNTRTREVFVARDRLGKKPVFYAVLDGVVHVASEIKALRHSPVWDGALDLTTLEGYLSLGYVLEPATIHRHVRKLEAGHWMRIADGRIETRKYWDVVEFDTDRRPDAAILDDLGALLGDAVSCRLESEVPLGAFLSGGIDSGLVVSWMAEAHGAGVVTTSVGFEERAHNELDAAQLTASAFKTHHHPILLEPKLDEVFDTLVDAFDEPFADASAIPTYYVSKAARAHVTVALTGDGGDEAFGGYDFRYDLHALEARCRAWLPGRPGRAAVGWLGRHWPRSTQLPRPLRAGYVLENIGRSREAAYFADLCIVKPWDARQLLGRNPRQPLESSPVYAAVTEPYLRCGSASDVQRAQYADLKVYLPNDPLVKVDRTSMAVSLEVRAPLLDYRLIEFAFRLPADRKSRPGRSKHFLRSLGARRLPPALERMPKRGFTAPTAEWMRGRYRDWFRDEVLSPQSAIASLVDRHVLGRWVEEDAAGSRNRSAALWSAWCLERWARRHGTR